MRSCAIHVHKHSVEAMLLQQCREVTTVILSITPWLPTYMGQSLIRCNRDIPIGLADAVEGEAVVRRVDEECAHGVKLAAYLAPAVRDIYSILTFTGVAFEDEPVDIPVERITNDLAITKGLVILKCFKVALALTGFLLLIPGEVGFVDGIVINMGIVLVVPIHLLLLFILSILHSFLLRFCILHPSLLLPFNPLPLALVLHNTVHNLFIVR